MPGLVQYVVILICNLTNHETPWKDFKQTCIFKNACGRREADERGRAWAQEEGGTEEA